jgi:hypothetical protein
LEERPPDNREEERRIVRARHALSAASRKESAGELNIGYFWCEKWRTACSIGCFRQRSEGFEMQHVESGGGRPLFPRERGGGRPPVVTPKNAEVGGLRFFAEESGGGRPLFLRRGKVEVGGLCFTSGADVSRLTDSRSPNGWVLRHTAVFVPWVIGCHALFLRFSVRNRCWIMRRVSFRRVG